MELDLEWDRPLDHRTGADERLCGIDVFHDFEWLDEFRDQRTQFRNGKCLAEFVQDKCPNGKAAALLLTTREDVAQGLWITEQWAVCVVNIREYRAATGNTALGYLAEHLDVDITDVEELHRLTASTAPEVIEEFLQSRLDVGAIARWAEASAERLAQLREVVPEADGPPPSPAALIDALSALEGLSADDVEALAALFATPDRKQERLDLLRAVTRDSEGRGATGEVLAERTALRVQDARNAVTEYRELLADEGSTETAMQEFIENHPWLLGLDYAGLDARRSGPSGATDFLLRRFDGFSDILELKGPHEEIVRAPSIAENEAVPSPHKYALGKALAQAMAQALVYRDRLTRYADAAEELYGLPQTRDPKLILVVGNTNDLAEHQKRVLVELNKSLHRVEIVPYDLIAERAEAVLSNAERLLIASSDQGESGDGSGGEEE